MNHIPEIIRLMKENEGHFVLARDSEGKSVLPSDPTACQFCALGAIAKAYGLQPKPELVPFNSEYGEWAVRQQERESFYKQLESVPLVTRLSNKLRPIRPNERYADIFQPIYSVFDYETNGPQLVINALEEIQEEIENG